MSKINCYCGEQMNDICSPCSSKGYIISDVILDKFDDVDIILDGMDMWECKKCGRLAIEKYKERTLRWFFPMSKKYENILNDIYLNIIDNKESELLRLLKRFSIDEIELFLETVNQEKLTREDFL